MGSGAGAQPPHAWNTSAVSAPELCARIGDGWDCRGTATSTGFLLELFRLPRDNRTLGRETCGSFLLLPAENTWTYQTRGVLYAFGLAYCFVGLAIITAIFMEAMENIVNQRKQVVRKDTSTGATEISHEKIWNSTVADITLLAFGSSSPQISLTIIDSLQHLGQPSIGGVGPGTIIGSAAFNLFAILTVCVLLPRRDTVKRVEKMGVFIVELTWSIWAYVWLFLMLKVFTPNEVTLGEAVLTVLQFPMLILHAYAEDKHWPYVSVSFWSKKMARWVQSTSVHSLMKQKPSMHLSSNGHCMSERAVLPSEEAQLSTSLGNEQTFGSSDIQLRPVDAARGDLPANSVLHRDPDLKDSLGDKWKAQLFYAMTIRVSPGDKVVLPKLTELLKHAFTIFWRVLFSFIIPADVCHGWPTFVCALLCVTGISTIVIELANLLGCVSGISKYVIAVTVLASGTSWPDLIASKISVEHGSTADSCIANINSSNCINIFLGIGIPWLIQVSYNRLKLREGLRMQTTGLSFSLMLYFITFSLCWVVVFLRRFWLGGELGGPRRWAWGSSAYFMLLWLTFLVFSCLKSTHLI